MNKYEFQIIRFVLIFFSFMLFFVEIHGQTETETEHDDTTQHAIINGDGKNYATTYHYYINSLFPITIEKILIDTSVFKPYNEDISLFSRNLYANLGIFGQANYSMNFSFYRKHGFSYKTLPYNTYLRTIENWKLHLPEEVYADLQYNFSNGKENRFSVAYSQKIADNLQFDLGLESIIAEGLYVSQQMRTVNVGASLRYKLPSNRYGFAAYYFLNLIKNQENGGILRDADFEDSLQSPRELAVRFASNNASNNLFQNTFFLRHYLSLSGKRGEDSIIKNRIGYLVHDFEVGSSKNIFDAVRLDPDCFPMSNFSKETTYDWVKNFQIRNSIFWSSYMPEDTLPDKKHFIRFAAGIMHTFVSVKDTCLFFKQTDTILSIFTRAPFFQFNNNQITPLGILHIKLFDRLHIKANGMVTLNGYNAGDVTIDGKVVLDFFDKGKVKHEIQAKVAFYNYSPDYFFTHLMANNYSWRLDLKKQQTITAGIAWEHKNYSIGLNYYTLNNYTLLNENSFPEQINQFINVYQFAAYIPFHIKGFGINSNIYLQYTESRKLQIPNFVTRQTVYYGFSLFKKALYLQLGLDFMYNTVYYADAYNPVLQQFHTQDDKKIGNYPYLDVFLRAKLNRFQFQIKGTHLWSGLLGNKYYLVPHYPAKGRGIALGILWRFYD